MPKDGLSEKETLRAIAEEAIATVKPGACIPPAVNALLQTRPKGTTHVFGAGKAAAQMAAAFERAYHWPIRGMVVTRYGFGCATKTIEVCEASHPIPDEASLVATQMLLERLDHVQPDDHVVFLLSGGASALLCAPKPPLGLQEKQNIIDQFLRSGAPILEINTLRACLSEVKAGRLAQRCRAPITTLAISDVVGDDPRFIGSGPTVPFQPEEDAIRSILSRYAIDLPEDVLSTIGADAQGQVARPGDHYRLIASSRHALETAQSAAKKRGFDVQILGWDEEGNVKEVAQRHARAVVDCAALGRATLFLSGGELTVMLSRTDGKGKGGPNQEYVLYLARALAEYGLKFYALAVDTDGVDGSEDNAGGYADHTTWARAAALELDPSRCLQEHDSYRVFDALDDLIVTGPTGTNVNDLRMVLVHPS